MFSTLIIGGGPGGTGPLLYAAQAGLLDNWLKDGVAIVERNDSFGGTIGRYIVNSDSLGGVYLEMLEAPALSKRLKRLSQDSATTTIRTMAAGLPPLPLVGAYFETLGEILEDWISASPASRAFLATEARRLRLEDDGSVVLDAFCGDKPITIRARSAVVALGGRPRAAEEMTPLLSEIDGTVIASDRLLTRAGFDEARTHLKEKRAPRAVILGGAHSAYSAAWLLTTMQDVSFDEGSISIFSRRRPRIYYPMPADADHDCYLFDADDICPRTGRINRMAGLRGDGKELWRAMNGRRGRIERRVAALLGAGPHQIARYLKEADLIVPAFGYAARTLPIFDASGHRLPLRADEDGRAVDAKSRLVLSDGTPIANLFGIGLGHGFRPSGVMGGEPSFRGQANSLWLYQNHIGRCVYEGIRALLAEPSSKGAIASVIPAKSGRQIAQEDAEFAETGEGLVAATPQPSSTS